jgi:serine/threonine protein kinase
MHSQWPVVTHHIFHFQLVFHKTTRHKIKVSTISSGRPSIQYLAKMNHHQYPQTICIPQHLELTSQEEHQFIPGMMQSQGSIQWPAHMAHRVTDSIHSQVRNMLGKSRLVRKSQGIRLLNPADFVHRRVLGTGAFSQVSSVQVGNETLACKHLKPELMKQPEQFRTAAAELAYEAHMLSSLDHPHILKIRGWAENGIASFDAGRHDSFFLLLDVLDETLDQRIQRWGGNSPDANSNMVLLDKIRVLNEIASALHYVHEQGIVFRDLKPDNIGFLGDSVQLFDFGLSRELPTLDTTTPYMMSGKVGTIRYMAPEVVLHQPYNVGADVYSWSMVAYEVLVGEKPYNGWTPDLHADYVCKGGMRPNVGNLCDDLSTLLQGAWHSDPTMRPTLPQIMMQLQQVTMRLQTEQQQQQHEVQLHQQQQKFMFEQQQHQPEIFLDLNDANMHMFLQDQQQQHQRDPFPQHRSSKMRRCRSSESIETIETSSMSTDSLDWW